MNQVAKAMERLEPWLPLRESASFSGAFDAVYSGAHADIVTLWRELDEQKKPSEFVPHFKLHRDGSVTPQQDDTFVWTLGTMNEEKPLALAVTESAVEEVEVTQEAASWRAGGTGVPTFWNLDKLREMRDGALQEWIEVEAIIREAEKREKEEAPIRDKVREIQDVLYPDRNDISADEARRVQVLARYLVEKEQS